jgi:hypothetical protein
MHTSDGGYQATETILEAQANLALDRGFFGRPADDPPDYRFTDPSGSARIPFADEGRHLFVRGSLNGSEPLWLAIDTGASDSLLDAERAKALDLDLQGRQRVAGAGGAEEGSYASGLTVELPGVVLERRTWSTAPLAAATGHPVDGILGYDLFSRFVVEIDYAGRQVRLHEPGSYEYRGAGDSLPLALQDNQPHVLARVMLPGQEPLEGEFVIDTGSGSSLMLSASFVDAHKAAEAVGKTIRVSGQGVGGTLQLEVARLQAFELGRSRIDRPLVVLARTGEIAGPGKAGNIGSGILRRFRVVFDYARQRMILEPNADFLRPDE